MRPIRGIFGYFAGSRQRRENLRRLAAMLLMALVLIGLFSVVFHHLMAAEGRQHSVISGLYWVCTVMTTLGFGDITFATDGGRAFSVVVMLTGLVYQAVILPFAFIQFLWAPWLEAQQAARTPRRVPADERDHVLLCRLAEGDDDLVEKLRARAIPFRILAGEAERDQAGALHDRGFPVLVGELDDPATWRAAGAERAALVVANREDHLNAMIAATVREVAAVPLVATAETPAAAEILLRAGCDHVLRPALLIGQAMARRACAGSAVSQRIGTIGTLVLAEASVLGGPLAGRPLAGIGLRERYGLAVVGVWERGQLHDPRPDLAPGPMATLVLAGRSEQFDAYDQDFAIYQHAPAPVLVIGGGRVGRAACEALSERQVDWRLVEREGGAWAGERLVAGDAADRTLLEKAGLGRAPAVLITTNDDNLNVFLAIHCRLLAPDVQIVARAAVARNVSSLYRVGADQVLSFPALAANLVFNLLDRGDVLLVAEGLAALRVPVPEALAGRSLGESGLRSLTGCTVLAIEEAGVTEAMPGPERLLPRQGRLLMTGTMAAVDRWFARFGGRRLGSRGPASPLEALRGLLHRRP